MSARDIIGVIVALLAVAFAVRLVNAAGPFVPQALEVASVVIVLTVTVLGLAIWRTAAAWPHRAVVTCG